MQSESSYAVSYRVNDSIDRSKKRRWSQWLMALGLLAIAFFGIGAPANSTESFVILCELAAQQSVTGNTKNGSAILHRTAPLNFDERLGLPGIKVRVNNRLEADFLLNMGSTNNMISRKLALLAGLQCEQIDVTQTPALSGLGEVDIAKDADFTIGEAIAFNAEAVANDTIFDRVPGHPFDGVISGSSFDELKAAVLLDSARETVAFYPNGNFTDKERTTIGFGSKYSSGITLIHDPNPDLPNYYIPVTIMGKGSRSVTVQCTLDTGSARSVFYADAQALGLAKLTNQKWIYLGPPTDIDVFSSTEIQVGGAGGLESAVLHMPVSFMPGATSDPQHDSVLGMDFLSHFTILIDYPARKLYLKLISSPQGNAFPTAPSRIVATRTVGDLTVRPTAAGSWIVRTLEPGGVFSGAGIHTGDTIVSLDGVRVDGFAPDSLVVLLAGWHTGNKIVVQRNGKTKTL